jgi:hypothetical protein
MSKVITRYTAKLFDAAHSFVTSGNPNNDIGQFGSAAASSPVYTSYPDVIQALPAFTNGWTGAVTAIAGGTTQPNLEDVNALHYLTSYFQNYMFQEGISEWDSGTTYYQGSFVKSTDGLGTLYVSVTDGNVNNNPATDASNWIPYINLIISAANKQLLQASVSFDATDVTAGNCNILNAYNVSSVNYVQKGVFQINFATALTTSFFSWSGSCGSKNNQTSGLGDNNVLTGGAPGFQGLRTNNALRVFAWEPYGGGSNPGPSLENPQVVCVTVFGT